MLAQTLKNKSNTRDVFLQINRVHHEVVHIDDEPSFGKVISEDVVHECLKRRRRIALAKEHHRRFVKPIRSSESGLPLVGLLYPNVVISPSDIEFRKVARVFERIDEIRDTREGVGVFDRMRIDIAVVLARAERSILLRHEEERGRLRGLGRDDLSFLEILIDEHL